MAQKIGFTCGAFDVTHAGHYLMFEECRRNCDYLIVGLHSDPTIDRPEKNKPIQSKDERMIQLKACKYIDAIVEYDTEFDLYGILQKINPHVRFVGEDWRGRKFTGYDLPIKIFYNSRGHNYSSTNLRRRIFEAEAISRGMLYGVRLLKRQS